MPNRIFALLVLLALSVSLPSAARVPVKRYMAKVVAEYPHDRTSYTQGLFFYGGCMYESAGQYGESSFRKVDFKTGNVLQRMDFESRYFVEGSVALNGRVYVLTWRERACFVYDVNTWSYLGQFYNPGEGWGLTTDGTSLVISDGTSSISFLNPSDFSTIRKIDVTLNGKAVNLLNELEYIDGKIWANVLMSDDILVIDPGSGEVTSVIDCSGVYPPSSRGAGDDVFNGIAYDPSDGAVYVTGKYWGKLYKIELIEK